MQHAAEYRSPPFEAAKALIDLRSSSGNPRSRQRQRCPDEFASAIGERYRYNNGPGSEGKPITMYFVPSEQVDKVLASGNQIAKDLEARVGTVLRIRNELVA